MERMPVMRWRVVCALREVMLIFWPTKALSKVDFPTLGLPTMAIRPQRWPSVTAAGALLARVAMACASMASSASGDCEGARPVAIGSCGGTAFVPLVMRIHRGLLSGSAG